jgi:hypothetical protein
LEEKKVNMGKSNIREHYVSHFCLKYIRSSFSALIIGQLAAAAAGHNEFQWAIGVAACRGAINSSALWNQLVMTTSPSPISLTT